MTYRLDADESKLSPHVGHKVEITGTLDSTSSSATSTSPAGSSSTAPASTGPKLKVDNVKMIATSCTP